MRLNHALFVLLFIIPLTAQEVALPPVTPRTPSEPPVMLIATAVEPVREFHGPTLAQAARENDYVSFDALYREAKARGESVAQYETLHELWTYNVTDPIGAFYGAGMYEKLVRAYPGFAQFIEDQSVVDSRGNVFYPTAETREYVLARALEGRAPRVLLADTRSADDDERAIADVEQEPVAIAEATPARRRPRFKKAEAVTTPPPALVQETPKAALQTAPVAIAEATPAPAVEETPAFEAAPIAQPAAAQQQPVQAGLLQPRQAATTDDSAASRGILLIVMGLIGIGLLAVMFRTPKETFAPSAANNAPAPNVDEKPVAPVEPLKRPEGQQQRGKHRANGSRG